MNAIRLYKDNLDELIGVCVGFIILINKNRNLVFKYKTPVSFLVELYYELKRINEVPELPVKRKNELWLESGKNKRIYTALYVVEISNSKEDAG